MSWAYLSPAISCTEIMLHDWLKIVMWLGASNQSALFKLIGNSYAKICFWHRLQASTTFKWCHNVTWVSVSVTKIGKIKPLWQHFIKFCHLFEVSFSIGRNFEPYLAIFMRLGKFSLLYTTKNWTTNLAIWSHRYACAVPRSSLVIEGDWPNMQPNINRMLPCKCCIKNFSVSTINTTAYHLGQLWFISTH